MSVQRMIRPVRYRSPGSRKVLLEYQRDWAHKETYGAVMGLVQGAQRRLRHGRGLRLHHGSRRRRQVSKVQRKKRRHNSGCAVFVFHRFRRGGDWPQHRAGNIPAHRVPPLGC